MTKPSAVLAETNAAIHQWLSQANEIALRIYETSFKTTTKTDGSFLTEADQKINQLLIEHIRARFRGHNIISEEAPKITEGSVYSWIIDPIDGTFGFVEKMDYFCNALALAHKRELIFAAVNVPLPKVLGVDEPRLVFLAEAGKPLLINSKPWASPAQNELGKSKVILFGKDSSVDNAYDSICREASLGIRSFVGNLVKPSVTMAVCECILGSADAVIWKGRTLWDVAPGYLLATQAGLKASNFDGSEFDPTQEFANGLIIAKAGVHQRLIELLRAN